MKLYNIVGSLFLTSAFMINQPFYSSPTPLPITPSAFSCFATVPFPTSAPGFSPSCFSLSSHWDSLHYPATLFSFYINFQTLISLPQPFVLLLHTYFNQILFRCLCFSRFVVLCVCSFIIERKHLISNNLKKNECMFWIHDLLINYDDKA